MLRFRDGQVSTADIKFTNENCVISSMHVPGSNVPVTVYRKKNRDAINSALFEQYYEDNKPQNSEDILGGGGDDNDLYG
jgi:hypothetical protein